LALAAGVAALWLLRLEEVLVGSAKKHCI